jgi:hypothetical protein
MIPVIAVNGDLRYIISFVFHQRLKRNMIYIVLLLSFASMTYSFDFCGSLISCVACTESSHRCGWSAGEAACRPRPALPPDDSFVFDDTCPVDYGEPDVFLSDWMGRAMPVLGSSPLLALSLPGTHDTLTYDLSTTVSEGGIDELYKLAELLHNKTDLVPGERP